MKNILILSKREVTRLRARFSGKSRAIVPAIILLTVLSSLVIYQQDLVISKGLYNVGVSPDGPSITDSRFVVVELDRETGYEWLRQGDIDIYIDDGGIIGNNTERSDYAAGAVKQYLEKLELLRVAGEYEIDEAFPLRIEVSYLDTLDETMIAGPAVAGSGDDGTVSALPREPAEPAAGFPDGGDTGDIMTGETSLPPELIAALGIDPETGEETALPPELIEALGVSLEDGESSKLPPELIEALGVSIAEEEYSNMPPELIEALGITPGASPPSGSSTDDDVRQQLEDFSVSSQLPEFKAEFLSENDIIVPSLMNPPIPLAQVIITFLYVVPVFFISLFFTSSFTEEKVSRKLIVLLSAPVTRLQVILGKMLPYLAYSIIVIIAVTMLLRGDILLGLAIFVPVMLFIFSIYLIVALTYRTFKDQTFFSVLALSVVTVYLVGPAMFTGVNDLSYISPLTLAVHMYRGESFGVPEYFLATTPLFVIFTQTMYVGTRVFNEEYLMGFRPLHAKVSEAIYMTLDRRHLNVSVFFMSMCLVPLVFVAQLASIVFVSNLPLPFILAIVLIVSVVVEEIAKSASIAILLKNRALNGWKDVLRLSVFSALGFLLAEKLLLFLAMSVVSDDTVLRALSGGGLLVLPLTLHIVSTSIVCLLTSRLGTRAYPVAIVAGSIIHAVYNIVVMGAML